MADFHRAFNLLLARGGDRTRVAAALMPILVTSTPALPVLRAACASLELSPPISDEEWAGSCSFIDLNPAVADLTSGIDLNRIQRSIQHCTSTGSASELVELIAVAFASPRCMMRSWPTSTAPPPLALGPTSTVLDDPMNGSSSAPSGVGFTPVCPYLNLPPCPIDFNCVLDSYSALLSTPTAAPVADTLKRAQLELLARVAAPEEQALAAVLVALNPLALDPSTHETGGLMQRLMLAVRRFKSPALNLISSWLSNASAAPLQRALDALQQYITLRILRGGATVDDVSPPVALLRALHDANEEALRRSGAALLPFQAFYNGVVSEDISLRDDFKRWRAGTSTFSFCANAFLLDAAAKSSILTLDAAAQQEVSYRSAVVSSLLAGGVPSPIMALAVHRDRLVEDALQGIVSVEDKAALKRPLKVSFHGEDGLDEGGVRKEFFSLLTAQLLTPDYGMFSEEAESSSLWFNAHSMEANIQFELVGSLLGLAIYNSVILDVRFPLVLYRKLKHETVTLRDLAEFRPTVARHLRSLLDYAGSDVEDVFGLNFTVTTEAWGAHTTHELVPGGASMPVTASNRHAYVAAYLKWALVDSIAPQYNAFARGFANVAGGPALDLFRPDELQLLVTGSATLDFHALEKVAEYEAPYHAAHSTIVNFWSVVHNDLDEAEQRMFLKFATGSDRAPIRGLGSMRFIVDRAGPDSDRLLGASTCFNFVHLPDYVSRDKLRDKLKLSIQHHEGFGVI